MEQQAVKPCDKKPGVFYFDIFEAYLILVKTIIELVVNGLRFIVLVIYSVVTFIFMYCAFLIPFIIIGFVFWGFGKVSEVLWDKTTKPIIVGIIKAYNGIAKGWNTVTGKIRHIGINERFFGTRIKITLFSINLPEASLITADIKGFWDFIYNVLMPDVIKKRVLDKIFRPPGYIPPQEETTFLNKI